LYSNLHVIPPILLFSPAYTFLNTSGIGIVNNAVSG
jgi:hypothetical protein